jgi:hypothetical protein
MPFGALSPLPLRLGGSPTEGWAPEQHARLCADLQALKRVAPLAVAQVHQETVGDVAITHYRAQNGVGLSYAPDLVENGEGDVTLTWPAYWTDEYDVQWPIKIRQARASCSSDSAIITGRAAMVELVAGRSVRVRTRNHTGAVLEARFTLKVW